MSNGHDDFFRSEAIAQALRIDQMADRFEQLWRNGTIPDLGEFVADQIGEPRIALLEELILIDQEYRSQSGQVWTRDDYRVVFPELPQQFVERRHCALADNVRHAFPEGNSLPVISTYEVLDELGRGSMGVVYRARQRGLNRIVALKVILVGSLAGKEQRDRFRLEVEAVGRLQHPNIVQVFEVGEHEGLPYCSFEYVAGGSLAQRINGAPLQPRQAAELLETLARAVQTAHEQGIVHRDLKPANVLLTVEGRPKIADFGLAKQLDTDSGYTQTGVAIGTPSYMAVEQAEGRTHDIGPATDVYALGAILYELLSGRPAFRGATLLDTLEQVRSSEPVPPRHLQSSLPRDLDTICLKAMAREASRRYPSARALADDLRRWLDGRPIVARPAGPFRKTLKWARRRPALAALLLVAVASAMGGTSGAWWHFVQLRQALTDADEARRQADTLRIASDEQRERAEAMVYATDVQLAAKAYDEGDTFEASRRLEIHRPVEKRPDRREFTWNLLSSLCQPSEVEFHAHEQDVYAVRVISNGDQLLTAGRDGTLRLWNIGDPGHHEILGRYGTELNFLALAPDGATVIVGSDDGTVRVWNLTEGREIGHFVAHSNWVLCGAISPGGDLLATAGRDNVVRLWSLGGELQRELVGHSSTVESVVFLPDGHRLASTSTDKTLRLWDLSTGNGSVLGTHRLPAVSVACSHDGRLLATGCEDHQIYLWEVETSRLRSRLAGHIESVQCVEFSPDDTRLASAGKDGSVRIWNLARQAQVETFGSQAARVWSVAWLPDGTGLASSCGDGSVRLRRRQVNRLDMPWEEASAEVSQVFLPRPDCGIWYSDAGRALCIREAGKRSIRLESPLSPQHYAKYASVASRADKLAVVWTNWPEPGVLEEPGSVYFYTTKGERLRESLDLESQATCIALAPDGGALAIGYRNGRLDLFALPLGRLRWTAMVRRLTSNGVTFTRNANEVVVQTTAGIWDAYSVVDGSRRSVLELDAKDPLDSSLVFMCGDRQFVTGGAGGAIRVWNFHARNDEVLCLRCNDGAIRAVALSPDCQTLAAGSDTGTVLIWHVPTWQQLARFITQLDRVNDVCFSAEGDSLAVGGQTRTGHGQVLIWGAQPASN